MSRYVRPIIIHAIRTTLIVSCRFSILVLLEMAFLFLNAVLEDFCQIAKTASSSKKKILDNTAET